VSGREVVALGTASQVPTRERNHVATVVRLGEVCVLVDCGEGTQRQMVLAGVRSSQLDALCVTHEHGDHCFGVPGVLQRRRLDGARDPLPVVAADAAIARLSLLTEFATNGPDPLHRWVTAPTTPVDNAVPVEVLRLGSWSVQSAPLLHRVPTVGYRFVEDDGRRLVPDLLAAAGIAGPEVGLLQRGQQVRGVSLADVSVVRRGQRLAVIMDTAMCEGAFALAQECDLLVCEATFLDAEIELAREHRHLTARQAAEIAVEAGVRRLVLTHFSSRYDSLDGHIREAGAVHAEVSVARDLDVIAVPGRR
jgi:ribonuclease Z